MRESGIYALVNRENGKRYVGRSVDLRKRKITHLCYPQVGPQTIYDIVHGRRWQSVPMDKDALKQIMESEESNGRAEVTECCDNI